MQQVLEYCTPETPKKGRKLTPAYGTGVSEIQRAVQYLRLLQTGVFHTDLGMYYSSEHPPAACLPTYVTHVLTSSSRSSSTRQETYIPVRYVWTCKNSSDSGSKERGKCVECRVKVGVLGVVCFRRDNTTTLLPVKGVIYVLFTGYFCTRYKYSKVCVRSGGRLRCHRQIYLVVSCYYCTPTAVHTSEPFETLQQSTAAVVAPTCYILPSCLLVHAVRCHASPYGAASLFRLAA